MGDSEMITSQRLRRLLKYTPETGIFTWRVNRCRVVSGDEAGRITAYGYLSIKIDQVDYAAHRLAWLYMTGEWPVHQIDHQDRVRLNNRWTNLRPATNKQNHENLSLTVRNTSGFPGVRWDAQREKWYAFITSNGKMRNLGRHLTQIDAVAARLAAERELFTHSPACAS